ncbi:MAG: DNA primase [Bifidobacteriaceae bacterium]|nr:DNA primase [Bifidobacteriaceae bacterium]
MNAEPRAALQRLVAALERHFEAVASGRGDQDQAYEAAYRQLIEAFEAYDDVLYDAYGADTPFLVYDEDEDGLTADDLDEEDFGGEDSDEELF